MGERLLWKGNYLAGYQERCLQAVGEQAVALRLAALIALEQTRHPLKHFLVNGE